MVRPKTPEEIQKIRQAGRIVALALDAVEQAAVPGISTRELDTVAERVIRSLGAEPAFKGQRGARSREPFPGTICASVNDEVVHGVPGKRKLVAGDLLSVDVGARWEGYIGDGARSFGVGPVAPHVRLLLDVCREALIRAIARLHVGVRVSDISGTVEDYVVSHGMSVVRDLVGHGVGRELWEEPQVPNFRSSSSDDPELPAGSVIAIEPMICAGDWRVRVDSNGWTVRTVDGSFSAHFEHTVAVTPSGAVILTLP